jgi:single-strand DNA-binding protein
MLLCIFDVSLLTFHKTRKQEKTMSTDTNGTMNQCILIGFLGFDPEVFYMPKGTAVCHLRIATNRRVGSETRTDWHRVTIWGKAAETAKEYLVKGRKVQVQGSMQTRSFENKNGEERWVTELHTNGFQYFDAPKNGGNQGQSEPSDQ